MVMYTNIKLNMYSLRHSCLIYYFSTIGY